MVFNLEGLLGDLEPGTMRRIARQLHRQRVTLLERADWLEDQQRRLAKLARKKNVTALTPRQKKRLDLELRDLSIVRDAWKGMTDIQLATKYHLSRKRIWQIRKAAAARAAQVT